ncbi:MAG TPA: 50S ribosomal protein L11 methyltransferase [Xanthobacteraceae bacterium]|nr:50S ribosomal protein L11 methyltransferase [Xanthobacteraceae bacterium]
MNYPALPHAAATRIGTLTADEQSARRVADRFAEAFFADEVAVSLVDAGHGRWRVTFYFRSNVNAAAVRALAISAAGAAAGKALRFERVAAKDWVAESLLGLKPITAGRFIVYGAHDRGCALPNRIGIEIEAAQAFGTGHHGSTRGCLLALDQLCKSAKARRILDLGTGSGVLAIAAAKSLRRRVLASDIDAQAVQIACDNARLNRCAGLVRVCRANGLAAADIRASAPFDLVIANILLAPLQSLAAPLTGIVARRGRIVLSGLLNAQASAARAFYPHFTLERRIAVDGWTTLVLRRSAGHASSHYLPLKGEGRRPKAAGWGSTPGSLRFKMTPPRRAWRVDPPLSGEGKVNCR